MISSLLTHKILDRETERTLTISFYRDRSAVVLQRLVTSNLRYVHRCVVSYTKNKALWDDLFQEGVIGLIEAIELFDPFQGTRLLSFAHKRIMWRINTTAKQIKLRGLGRTAKGSTFERLENIPVLYVPSDERRAQVTRRLLEQFAETLGLQDRRIFKARYLEDRDLREIARKHWLSKQRIYQIDLKLRRQLKKFIKTQDPDLMEYVLAA